MCKTMSAARLIRTVFFLLIAVVLVSRLYALEAETDFLKLIVDDDKASFVIEDLTSGASWRSSPTLRPEDRELPEVLQGALCSTFRLLYTDGGLEETYDLYEASDKVRHTVEPWGDGIIVHYVMEDEIVDEISGLVEYSGELRWSVGYRIQDDFLEVVIPEESMEEVGGMHFLTLKILPFFGANTDTENGALLLPAGHGALMPYRDGKPTYGANLSLPVYGEDEFGFQNQRRLVTNMLPEDMNEYLKRYEVLPDSAGLPCFGMMEEGKGLLGIIAEGESNAKINAAQRGFIVDYNRIGAEFIFRKTYSAYMSRTRQINAYERIRTTGDRRIRYYFFSGQSVDFLRLAERYRRYLVEEKNVENQVAKPLLNLRIFCGIQKGGFLSREFVAATTFAEARTIVEALVEREITDLAVTLVGWGKSGYYGASPNSLPPEPRLGGRRSLEDLVEYAHGHGIPIYLDTNYLIAIQGNRGFSPRGDVIKQEMEIPLTDGRGTFLLSPGVAYERLVPREAPGLQELGIDGLLVDNLGNVLLSDHDRDNRLQRSESRDYLAGILRELGNYGLQTMVTGRNAYTFPFISGFQQIAPFGNPYFRAPDEIPFFSAVLHGLIPYYSVPLNLSEDLTSSMLRVLEYGILPTFELTFKDPILLRDTAYNHLYSSEYTDWIDRIENFYVDAVQPLGFLRDLRIVGHEELAPDVFATVYEDGSQVVVNYGNTDFAYDGSIVESESYVVRTGSMRGF